MQRLCKQPTSWRARAPSFCKQTTMDFAEPALAGAMHARAHAIPRLETPTPGVVSKVAPPAFFAAMRAGLLPHMPPVEMPMPSVPAPPPTPFVQTAPEPSITLRRPKVLTTLLQLVDRRLGWAERARARAPTPGVASEVLQKAPGREMPTEPPAPGQTPRLQIARLRRPPLRCLTTGWSTLSRCRWRRRRSSLRTCRAGGQTRFPRRRRLGSPCLHRSRNRRAPKRCCDERSPWRPARSH